ncbi:hypothetical protein V8C34DRAFT_277721 [Trichoderma compactum]
MPCPGRFVALDLDECLSVLPGITYEYCAVATVVLVTHFGLRLPNLTFPERRFILRFYLILFYCFFLFVLPRIYSELIFHRINTSAVIELHRAYLPNCQLEEKSKH